MAGLIAKKLSKLPIGTHAELTYENGIAHIEKACGIVTDSDFTANIEITAETGEEIVIDYSIVRSVSVTKSIETVLKELAPGSAVRFSYGVEATMEPNLSGIVLDNDNKSIIEVKLTSGQDLVLNYSVIHSLLVQEKAEQGGTEAAQAAVHKPAVPVTPEIKEKKGKAPLYQQSPTDAMNASDGRLKELFDRLPKEERKQLSRAYDSFKFGIKNNDSAKMLTAANWAKALLFAEDDRGYRWSRNAILFCGCLLRRVKVYDYEIFLLDDCFYEAALACWKTEDNVLAGAYATLALIDGDPNIDDLLIIIATSIVKADDASCLAVIQDHLPPEKNSLLLILIKEAFAAKGIRLSADQEIMPSLQMLGTLYPGKEIYEELARWLPESGTNAPEAGAACSADASDTDGAEEAPEESSDLFFHGVISRLNWADKTGVITGEDEETYKFAYKDILDAALLKKIEGCLRADLNGAVYLVKYRMFGTSAKEIVLDNSLVDRARAISADPTREGRFEVAFDLCKKALNTSDIRRALGDLIKHAITLYNATQSTNYVKEALELVEKNIKFYPENAFAVMDVALCYSYIKKYQQVIEFGDKAMAFPGLGVKQKIALLANYLRMLREAYEASGDKSLLTRMLEQTSDLRTGYSKDFSGDAMTNQLYTSNMLPYRVIASCGLDLLEDAEEDYAKIPDSNVQKAYLDELMAKTRSRLAPPQEPEAEEAKDEQLLVLELDIAEDAPEEAEEEEILPYTDTDGWAALDLTKEAVIDYAIHISGDDRIPAIVAYLRAASMLNGDITSVYRSVALAVNDPMAAPDYSITALVNALAGGDTSYNELNEFCMGAAFLRSAFHAGTGYDYSAKGLRDSISVIQTMSSLRDACDTLEEFHKEAGRPIDIYADYRNHGVKKLKENLSKTVQHAGELYTKFILSPAREGVKFARLLETKKIVFSREGYLASMLHFIMEQDQDALEQRKEHFVTTYLKGVPQFSAKHIDAHAIDNMIVESWELAGKNMQLKKANAPLQGERRNNLRSNISDILNTICQWYELSEQSAGLTWRTEQGEAAYARLRPQLLAQLQGVHAECAEQMKDCTNAQRTTGLFLLAATARELSARLNGTWKFGQEKYFYVDFLKGNHITLDKDFMPELSSTFCVLPEFNILARIRNHVEAPKLSFQQQLDQIYGVDKTCNNYGTADRIMEYLEAMGESESVKLPDNPELFVTHTEMQIDLRYRSFRETYALAINYGQIIKSDAFCYSLEDTVRYWYAFSKESKNYGFFTSILQHAEEQIHKSARQYEEKLEEQMDALVASNQGYFSAHPDYSDAIRVQIANQNFTVAEDWMARIRIGDFSLDIQQPEALGYLESFWNSFVAIYNQVFDASRPLHTLISRRESHGNKDAKRAQQLIDNWLNDGDPSDPDKIEQLLNLLGWQNISVAQRELPGDTRTEVYEVHKEQSPAALAAPVHPIAAFGSELEKKPMHVACLYGIYDCDRLFEKIRALDTLDGSKIILLNYALGQADRRALARKLKQRESGLRNVYIVIDRVLITYLAKNYNENLINRILMATAMPFSYCQPYVVESVHTMPPEIFIGRKDELLKIEQPTGVNLIYGGRQLGKSALFKKALADLDGREKQRAVLIDIKELDCNSAAKKLSTKLIDLGITPDAEITDDWDTLCLNIERRLRSENDEISYFLLMLDEADAFIDDCANCGYRPLAALKDVQQSLPGKFKYVLAGLHNIVRFNRQVALGNNSVITHMPSLKITPFHTPEAQELLTLPLSYLGFSLPSKVTVSQILATCNYFPGLIQLYAKKLIESIRAADYAGYDVKRTPPYVVSDAHLRRVMSDKEFVEQIYEKFEITLTLDQDQGSCYYPLTLLIGWMYNDTPSKNGYTAKDVLYHAKDLSVYPLADLDEEKIDALLQELQDLNILRSVSNNSYLLASKNFRDLLGSDEEILDKLLKVGGGPA